MNVYFDQPALLFLGLLVVPLAIFGWRMLSGLDVIRRASVVLLRSAIALALVVMLAGPSTKREHRQLTVIGLLDVSGSVQRFAQLPTDAEDRRSYLQYLLSWFRDATETKADDDRFGLVVFDGEAIAVIAPSTIGRVDDAMDVTMDFSMESGTSIADAIRLGLAMFPADTARRLVLVTDGNETVGDAVLAARQAVGASGGAGGAVPIDVLPIVYRVRGDVQIVRLEAPPYAQSGQTVTVRVIMEATEPTSGRLTISREGGTIDLNGPAPGRARRVSIPAGPSVQLASVVLGPTPVNRFEAVFEPDDPAADVLPDNNRAEAFTSTPGKGRILVLDSRLAERPNPLARLLRAAELPVEVQAPVTLPADLLALQNYALIILDDVPAYDVTTEQQELIARYVHDLGGGLIMVGGENAFGAGGWNGTPVEEVLPLELDPPKELRLPQAALVLVLDQSGSMNRRVAGARASQQEVANEAAALAIESLRAESLVGVVTFSEWAREYVPIQRNEDPEAIARRVRSITANGGTNIAPALRLATKMLTGVDAERKRVVCLTDGQSPTDDLDQIVESMKAQSIKLSTIAVGDDADHDTLKRLADIGEGEFYPVYNPRSLPRVLVDSVKSINKPLIKEVPFVPTVLPTGTTLTVGLDAAPTLGGLVVTAPRDDARATIDMIHPEGEPLLARWQAGLGRVAAFTSDAGGAWSASWAGWPAGDAFWAQLARSTARPAASHEAELIATITDGRLDITLEATDDEEGFVDYLEVAGTVYPPNARPQPVRLVQTAPGRYETSIPAPDAGNYIVALNPRRGSRQLPPVIGGASRTTGEEFRRYRSDVAVLDRILEITGGRRLQIEAPAAVDLFDRAKMPISVSLLPIWRLLLLGVLAALLLDIADRRIAWSTAALRRQIARAIARVTPAHIRGGEAAATLASLREASERHEDIAAARKIEPLKRPEPVQPPVRAESPPPPAAARVAAALGALLGRPRSASPPEPEPTDDTAPEDTSERASETTSSLLAAKRRTREQLDK